MIALDAAATALLARDFSAEWRAAHAREGRQIQAKAAIVAGREHADAVSAGLALAEAIDSPGLRVHVCAHQMLGGVKVLVNTDLGVPYAEHHIAHISVYGEGVVVTSVFDPRTPLGALPIHRSPRVNAERLPFWTRSVVSDLQGGAANKAREEIPAAG